ncbi:hypothetical protein C241_06546 [Bradyrhizobium lupini HPC(L)]|uniref:Uncharacterized protein n=1 Tax=Bradyrhizobium lupini HPC(L) TaxID=1229491 RepID=A0ABN0HP44_RHILU|nr:hypothetical protein C241_06546 [Bradyrhizobium lupini HPC(L)]
MNDAQGRAVVRHVRRAPSEESFTHIDGITRKNGCGDTDPARHHFRVYLAGDVDICLVGARLKPPAMAMAFCTVMPGT